MTTFAMTGERKQATARGEASALHEALAADIAWFKVLTDAERERAWSSLRFARAEAGARVCR